MKYYGYLHLTSQKLCLLLATSFLLVVVSLLCLITIYVMYWIIPVLIISLLLYVELIIAEKKSTAFILQSEIIINRVLAFGVFVYVIRKQLSESDAEALQDYFTLLEQKGEHPLSSYAINRLVNANIVFYRNEPIFP